MPGTAVQESILNDPEVIEAMASRRSERGSGHPRLFGFTPVISALTTLIELQAKTRMKRPLIPGLELREQKKISRLKSKLATVATWD